MKRKFRFNQKIMNCIGAAALIFVVLAMIISTWNVKRSVAAEVRVAAKRDRCGKPVSYTHLDVYKRQPCAWAISAIVSMSGISLFGFPSVSR